MNHRPKETRAAAQRLTPSAPGRDSGEGSGAFMPGLGPPRCRVSATVLPALSDQAGFFTVMVVPVESVSGSVLAAAS